MKSFRLAFVGVSVFGAAVPACRAVTATSTEHEGTSRAALVASTFPAGDTVAGPTRQTQYASSAAAGAGEYAVAWAADQGSSGTALLTRVSASGQILDPPESHFQSRAGPSDASPSDGDASDAAPGDSGAPDARTADASADGGATHVADAGPANGDAVTPLEPSTASGCGCTTAGRGNSGAPIAFGAAFALVAVVRRRRDRSSIAR